MNEVYDKKENDAAHFRQSAIYAALDIHTRCMIGVKSVDDILETARKIEAFVAKSLPPMMPAPSPRAVYNRPPQINNTGDAY